MTLSLRKPLVAMFAFLMMVATIGFAQPAQAAACAQDTTKWTSSSLSTIDGRSGYWTSTTLTGGSPCSDINVKNLNRSANSTGAYYSSTFGQWIAGSAGWVWGPQNVLKVVISSLTGSGVQYKTGANIPITQQQQLS